MTRLALLLIALLATASLAQAQPIPITTVSDAARAAFVEGRDAMGLVDFPVARARFDAALAADPNFALAHVYRGILAGGAERDEHIRRAVAAADGASPAERLIVESTVAHEAGDHERDVALMVQLTERHPDDPEGWLWLANTHGYLHGDSAPSAAAARRGIAADPSYVSLYNALGYAEMALGNADEAEAAFREQIRLAPDRANPYDSYGELLLDQGRLDEAEAQFRLALAQDPDFDNASMNLVRIAMERSDLRLEGAFADGDADAVAPLYAENAVVMAPDAPRVRGRDAIRDLVAGMIASGVDGVDIQTVNVLHFDDWAVRESDVLLSSDGQMVDRMKAMELWRLIDGEWLYVRDMFNSDGEAATASAR